MVIREYRSSDCRTLAELFCRTVHTANAKDYTKEQLDAWAPQIMDLEKWDQSFREHCSLIALAGDAVAGFGDIDSTGYLDRLFVHPDYQKQGIGEALCGRLEQAVPGRIVTHASITARPFFEKRGYRLLRKQWVERRGILLVNFVMEKRG